ncbi:hypothetical protein BLA9940_00028 [Burkholderia aenigmatica]|uniref:hypothetical protein n=1 Tax=Burkholderia cepacia complex TaxID=87882 RepID=UPI0013DE3D1B|nr:MULTISPECIES: hypothetical protein [Burkholderia cepacia complex]VWC30280.1 hypothetical protein BLA9940_00028 [Burkholderia aenigmatica]
MSNTRSMMKLTRIPLLICLVASLAACGHSTPSESDAKSAVQARIGDCDYARNKNIFERQHNLALPTDTIDPNSIAVDVCKAHVASITVPDMHCRGSYEPNECRQQSNECTAGFHHRCDAKQTKFKTRQHVL